MGNEMTEVWGMMFSHLMLPTVLRVGVAFFYGGRNRPREKRPAAQGHSVRG